MWIPQLDRDLVFIRSGLFYPIPAFLSDPGLFFAEIRAPLVAVITNSSGRAKTTTENKSQINLTLKYVESPENKILLSGNLLKKPSRNFPWGNL